MIKKTSILVFFVLFSSIVYGTDEKMQSESAEVSTFESIMPYQADEKDSIALNLMYDQIYDNIEDLGLVQRSLAPIV